MSCSFKQLVPLPRSHHTCGPKNIDHTGTTCSIGSDLGNLKDGPWFRSCINAGLIKFDHETKTWVFDDGKTKYTLFQDICCHKKASGKNYLFFYNFYGRLSYEKVVADMHDASITDPEQVAGIRSALGLPLLGSDTWCKYAYDAYIESVSN